MKRGKRHGNFEHKIVNVGDVVREIGSTSGQWTAQGWLQQESEDGGCPHAGSSYTKIVAPLQARGSVDQF